MVIEIKVLGPVEIWAAGSPVPLCGARQRRVLAALAQHAGRSVPLGRLVDAVWDGEPPSSARRQVQDLVTRLRRDLLASGATGPTITTTDDGYRLSLDGSWVDAHEFAALTTEAQARAATDPGGAAATLRAALGLWRGPAFAGLDGRVLRTAALVWDERRVAAQELLLRLEVTAGHAARVLDELATLTAEHPFRESLVELRMTALASAGRRAESLTVYHELRRLLTDELGIDPCPQVQSSYRAILRSGHLPKPSTRMTAARP
jgi:DNA-binding SARP family transcriptional activator